jgi:hypothetical protein
LTTFANPYVERLIGSIRRDCLDHFLICNARHLKRTLSSYFTYYHGSRTHLGLDKQCPHVRSSRFRTSAACITVTNARQRNAMPADVFLANDRQIYEKPNSLWQLQYQRAPLACSRKRRFTD